MATEEDDIVQCFHPFQAKYTNGTTTGGIAFYGFVASILYSI